MFSSRCKNAITVLIYLSERNSENYISLKEINDFSEVSIKYLEQIMPKLIKAKYVEAKLGKSGGYRLKTEPDKIIIWDLLNLYEEDVYPVSELENNEKYKLGKTLKMREEFYNIEKAYFYSLTIKDLIEQDYILDYVI
ncbi:MAG: Rrf2 family transcriptional regulator [Bacilli bacterium]|nr:Rrf2 family transcriptional regulator [Bacilli bacterium]